MYNNVHCTVQYTISSLAYQDSCMKPCTDVGYEVSASKEVTDYTYMAGLTGCPYGQPFASLQFRNKIEIENVRLSPQRNPSIKC